MINTDDNPAGFDLATVDRLLTTTRAVRRRLDLDRPVPLDLIRDCLTIALQAPTGSNAQAWRWLLVTDPGTRRALADLYQNPRRPAEPAWPAPNVTSTPQQERVSRSAQYLTQHMAEVPVLVVPCTQVSGGAAGWPPSIYPAVWNFLLALRSRGLGSVITTVHLYREQEAAQILGVPEGYAQACLLPVAFYTGDDFHPANRLPLEEVAFLDYWGQRL